MVLDTVGINYVKRKGDGMLHVRSKTEKEINQIREEFEKNGVELKQLDKYKPVWH